MGLFSMLRRSTSTVDRSRRHPISALDAGPRLTEPVQGMTWGEISGVDGLPHHRQVLESAVGRRGVVSGRCEVRPVLHRESTDPHDRRAVSVVLDARVVGHLPAESSADYALALDAAGVVDVEVSGLITWSPDLRVPDYGVQLFACDARHVVPLNRPLPIPTMSAHAWCASATTTVGEPDADQVLDLCGVPVGSLDEDGVSLWATATVRPPHDVAVSVFGTPVVVGACREFASAVLRTAGGRSDVAVNLEALLHRVDGAVHLRTFYPLPWVRYRPAAP